MNQCPRCQTPFQCGMLDTTSACWCTRLPILTPEQLAYLANPLEAASATQASPASPSCYCPACLEQAVNQPAP